MKDIRDCPHCGSHCGYVQDTRPRDGYIYRRRKCPECGKRWTTREQLWSLGKKWGDDNEDT